MRPDMSKVVTESPRGGGRGLKHTPRRTGEEYEGYPQKQGMRALWRDHKSFSDVLGPLRGYLRKQVGRQWDDVWSEISAVMDFRSVSGYHIKTHLDQFVTQHVRMIDGVPHEAAGHMYNAIGPRRGRGPVGWREVDEWYVNPETGVLCYQARPSYRYRSVFQRRVDQGVVKVVDEFTQLHFVHHAWFIVELKLRSLDAVTDVLDVAFMKVRDRGWKMLYPQFDYPPEQIYGRRDVYAASKRQLSRREKKKYGVK